MTPLKDEIRSSFFLPQLYKYRIIESGQVEAESPSNIALIKYWGKKEIQIPANSSLSFTLSKSKTITKLFYKPKVDEGYQVKVYLDGEEKPEFLGKILSFFERIHPFVPFLQAYSFEIHTANTFPHSSGIASSASGFSALAICLLKLEGKILGEENNDFLRKASFLSRLGSGSACRSIYNGLVYWGENRIIPYSNKRYAVPYQGVVHSNFLAYMDTILILDKAEKKHKSSQGHHTMENHPFATIRYQMAEDNLEKMIDIFRSGDLEFFCNIVEQEALTLHAMMFTASSPFILLKPNSLSVIEKVWDFRKQTNLPVCFTIDAGANIHLLYPEAISDSVKSFIDNEIKHLCINGLYIEDKVKY